MNRYMKIAVDEAMEGVKNGEGGPFGAVIVKNGKIIGAGHNQVKAKRDPTCHAEIMAIHAACEKLGTFDLSGSEIYVTGEPCPMCMGAILWANISKIYYGCSVDDAAKIGFRDKEFYQKEGNRSAHSGMEELDRDECVKLYDEYVKLNGKADY